MWFRNLFARKEPPRLFLGAVAVVPRSGFKGFVENLFASKTSNLESELHNELAELFRLPAIAQREDARGGDLALDVVVPSFQAGEYVELPVPRYWLPIIWRPKVTLAVRLYHIDSGKTHFSYLVTKSITWVQYIRRLFTWRSIVAGTPAFTTEEMKRLLHEACISALQQVQKRI